MKLLDLFENFYHRTDNDGYFTDTYVQFDGQSNDLQITIKLMEYNLSQDLAGIIRSTIFDILKNEKLEGDYSYIGYLKVEYTKDLNGSSIILGERNKFFNMTRMIFIDHDSPEDGVNDLMSTFVQPVFPELDQCMTLINRSEKISRALTRSSKKVNVETEINLSGPKMRVISQISLEVPKEKEEELGLQLAKKLKPYRILLQLNGGPVIGNRD